MMVFDIACKVAIITGGASGLGLCFAKKLLQNGLRGVTLADVNAEEGEETAKALNKEFGIGKAKYFKTDVTDIKEFDNAFQETVCTFQNCDILVNNAGVMNDSIWEKEVSINMNGVIHGMLLGLENYLSKHKSGCDAVILNVSSVAGVEGFGFMPVYSATKFAVFGLTKCWGAKEHYDRKKVRVVGVCPGATTTPLLELSGKCLNKEYEEIMKKLYGNSPPPMQKPDHVANQVLEILQCAQNGSSWVVEGEEPAYEFVQAPRENYKENLLKK